VSLDVLYVSHNRLEMTRASFDALLTNTDWGLVDHLFVYDDASTDGTFQYLDSALASFTNVPYTFTSKVFGGPVAAMNMYLGGRVPRHKPRPSELFAKVDNDFVMPPRWLNDLHDVMQRVDELDIVGTEPMMGLDAEPEVMTHTGDVKPVSGHLRATPLGYTPASHIGGKGLIRIKAFMDRPMWANGRQGFTQWQHRNEDVTKAWITPDIKSFGLDQLPLEPWMSLTDEYVAKGWQRRWTPYSPDSHEYWDWWLEQCS